LSSPIASKNTGFVPPLPLPPKPAPAAIGGSLSNRLSIVANSCSFVEPLRSKLYEPASVKMLWLGTLFVLIVTSGGAAVA
jgi:hypothetical protein